MLLPLRHVVVATGGGTFVEPDNRGAINLDGLSVWLDVPIDVVLARLPADGRRPLAADRIQMEHLFAARRVAYAQAHLRIDVGDAPRRSPSRSRTTSGNKPDALSDHCGRSREHRSAHRRAGRGAQLESSARARRPRRLWRGAE